MALSDLDEASYGAAIGELSALIQHLYLADGIPWVVGYSGDLVLDALQKLLRKDSLITAISIDPETCTVELSGQDGQPLSASELSAGERQLLAVALLWGLARSTGQPLPVVIDTPLGRLDASHRERLLERYFPHASHQVILLSTDTEVDADSLGRLRRFIGHAYRLVHNDIASATTVEYAVVAALKVPA